MPLANQSRPMGFRVWQQGGRTNYQFIERPVAASRTAVGAAASAALAVGDAYALDANGNAYHAGADATLRGVVIGFRMKAVASVMGGNGPVSQDYLPATDAGFVLGIEDASAIFTIQSDTFATGNINGSFALADAAPDATLRQSRQTLNIGGGAGTQLLAIDIEPSVADNAYGANAQVLVKIKTATLV